MKLIIFDISNSSAWRANSSCREETY